MNKLVPTHTIHGYQTTDGIIHLDLNVIEYNELSKALTHMNATRAHQRKWQAKQMAEKNIEKQRNKPIKTLFTLDFVSEHDETEPSPTINEDIIPAPPTTPPPQIAPMMRYPNINIDVTKSPVKIAKPVIPRPSPPLNILKAMSPV